MALCAAVSPAAAWDGAARVKGLHSEVRLIAGGRDGAGTHRAAVEVRLDAGWKTYWRHPGDAGIPPRFDWSGSRNLASARVDWPAPARYTDTGGITYGYAGAVTFPVTVDPADPAQPVTLVLALDFGVCKDICIPAQAALEATSGEPRPKVLARIAQADATVPRAVPLAAPTSPAILALSSLDGPAKRFEVTVRLAPGAEGRLFVEGPEGWFFDAPEPALAGPDGIARIPVDLLERPRREGRATPDVTLTLTAGSAAIETRATLDAGLPPR